IICIVYVFADYISKSVSSLQCAVDDDCEYCDFKKTGDLCCGNTTIPLFSCSSDDKKVKLEAQDFLKCNGNYFERRTCENGFIFGPKLGRCVRTRQKRSEAGSARAGDVCSFNTDCQSGMFCGNGVCTCLSDFVSIAGYCWSKVNPGESGCIEDRQCEAVWPGAKCSSAGICECPDETVPAKSRDGTLCISPGIPPACPLPESNTGLPNPATVLANPSTHPLGRDTYMPVLCTSTSNEVHDSNGGDGSTWCIYPDGDRDIYIGDLYNCVPHPQVSKDIFPEYAESVDGICCHSRAFTCIQPLEAGNTPSVPRWWYNSITGTCSQFLWDPSMTENVSPNNFRTVEHCESFCRDTCRRGANQFSDSKWAMIEDTRVQNCAHSPNGCASEYQCTVIGSHQTCCPTVAHICSAYGGRMLNVKPDVNSDKGVLIAGGKPSTRYYYDADQGRCLNFLYNGLGNYNNFLTKQDCESFCSKLVCEYGNPLRIGDDWQRCSSNIDCPSSHQCDQQHRVCCPTAQTICTQPKRLGDCTNSVRRYWYNAQSRQCELFQYTGCQGNDNNFDTLLACQTKCKNVVQEPKCQHGRAYKDLNGNFVHCSGGKGTGQQCPANFQCFYDGTSYGCCPTKAYTCSLNTDKGVQCGSGRSYRYYFNSNKQSCESFQYEGCDGNSNNFQTAEECQDYCGIGGCPNGGQPLRDIASNQLMQCSEAVKCPHTHDCVTVTSNGNAAQRCCPSKMFICSQPPQQGNHCSKMAITRFYFNIVTKECAKFSYNGCNGNLNNFVSLEQCNNFCASAGCAAGETTYKDINSKKVVECNNLLTNSCPPDYTCRYDALGARHVCCGSTHMGVCPVGERAYVNPLDETVRECAINMPGSCPSDFLCRFSAAKNRYFCCASKNGNVCPAGKALYRGSKLLLPVRCTINSPVNTCTDGFSCQSRIKDVLQGYCCSIQNVCKNGAEFLVDDKTKMPRICTPGAFISCPAGYRCHRSSTASQHGFCCKGEINAPTEGCPPGEYAYAVKGNIESCDPFNIENKSCPSGYSCQFSIAFQRYQCCGKEPIEEEELSEQEYGCPSSQVALINSVTNTVVPCTSSADSCPLGYFCQFSEKNKQFQCCAHKSGCPDESVAFIDISGSPKECSPEVSYCPTGYSCQRIQPHKYLCCTMQNDTVVETDIFKALSTEQPYVKNSSVFKEKNSIENLKCLPSQVLVDGECRERGAIGSSCLVSDQCLYGSHCVNFVCICPEGTKEIDEVCIRVRKFTEDRTSEEFKMCGDNEVLVNGRCLKIAKIGERCLVVEQCFNGSMCVDSICRCPPNTAGYRQRCVGKCFQKEIFQMVSLKHAGPAFGCALFSVDLNLLGSWAFSSSSSSGQLLALKLILKLKVQVMGIIKYFFALLFPLVSANLCGEGKSQTPYLSKGSLAVICTKARCPGTSKCLFSQAVKNYVCCMTTNQQKHRFIAGDRYSISYPLTAEKGRKLIPDSDTDRTSSVLVSKASTNFKRCPNGREPLVFPATNQPLHCDPKRNQNCPKRYTCVQQRCCPETRSHRKDTNLKCPRHLVKVFLVKNGRRFSRCGRTAIRVLVRTSCYKQEVGAILQMKVYCLLFSEPSCPRDQRPVEGVCRVIKKKLEEHADDPSTRSTVSLKQYAIVTKLPTTLVSKTSTATAVPIEQISIKNESTKASTTSTTTTAANDTILQTSTSINRL
uniref:Kunitz/Bovine pancreatic trypsin inhibitor domain protein n=1 Tax=Syphacia muris TaxID=451379 RepID=A0A0N5AE10_9BILA